MSYSFTTIHDVQVLDCEANGETVKSEREALDLIGDAFSLHAEMVILPVERLDEAFFQLKTGLAGQIVQKFVQYRRRLVILGDISQYIAQSKAFKDYVYETNRGNEVWFLETRQELEERLIPAQ
ncbi:DUF4180 domain-containing protein [Ktedonospora formicarum]|uniref:DUF4180 domain-containing protein n=1 Tax=Ktedonospora formicarum TaxID=2778364 RepID=A0A8J3I6N7_9CHLR|nr:DUF4180 domain-containing protein [Ktedonospora formicarum]GHO47850.1 hypothetical protein KSX_60130 [Ktedonospora formicarum]